MGRFAYVSLVLSNSPGIRAKLEEHSQAAQRVAPNLDIVWLADSQVEASNLDSVVVYNVKGRNRLACRVHQLRVLRRLQQRYNGIILRYPLCDPLTFIGLPYNAPIVSEHHTKELKELNAVKDPRFWTEKFLGRSLLKRFAGFFCVTQEILDYEWRRLGAKKPGFVTFNGISVRRFPEQTRTSRLFDKLPVIRLVFASSHFPPYQGLDLVLQQLKDGKSDIELHICGKIPSSYTSQFGSIPGVMIHGELSRDALIALYSRCDLGIASFGLHRIGLCQGTTLKTREYLACGLPVVLGHHDPGFPKGFPYLCSMDKFNTEEIRNWCFQIRSATRQKVFQTSEPYISIDRMVQTQVAGLQTIFHPNGHKQNAQ